MARTQQLVDKNFLFIFLNKTFALLQLITVRLKGYILPLFFYTNTDGMWNAVLSIVAQISALVALVHSGDGYSFLGWYIPTYTASSLLLLPYINPNSKTSHSGALGYLFFCTLIAQLATTIVFFEDEWCGPIPGVCTLVTAAAYDLSLEEANRKR